MHALSDIDLEIPQGGYTAIMGPSGSGKSTLLNILGLLDRPSQGRYFLDNDLTTDLTDREQAHLRRHKIGFVFQSFHLIPRLSARDNIELPLMLAGLKPPLRQQRVHSILETFGLSDRADHRPDQLSGGQRQRVAIARATVMEPALILADEPTGNLDHRSGRVVIETLERLNAQGMTLIVVTHDPEIGRRANQSIRMVDGRIDDGTPEDPTA